MTAERKLWQAMRAQRWELAGATVLGFIAAACSVVLLGAAAWLIATAAGAPPIITLAVAAVLVRACALGRAIFRYGERLTGHDAAFRGLPGLRVAVYQQLERLAPSGIAHFGRGDLLTRLVSDVDSAVDLPLRVVLPWIQGVLVVLGTVVFFWWLMPTLALVMILVGMTAMVLVPWLISRITARAESRLAPMRGELSAALVTAFAAASDIQAFGAGDKVAAQLADIDSQLTRLGRREALGLGLSGALITAVQGIAVIASLCLVGPAVIDGEIASVWLAVAALLPLAVFDVLAVVPAAAIADQKVRAAAIRLESLALLETPVDEPQIPVVLPAGFSGLFLNRVNVELGSGAALVLEDINVEIASNEHVYLVGPSGAGKSTLVSVLMGFTRYSGSITINGVELISVSHDELRQRVGLLEQRAHIFGTTIAENVTLGREIAAESDVLVSLSHAQLDSMLARLPDGVNTQLGSFGATISGGEAQRIAVARLLIEPRALLLLDEPSAHLDAENARTLETVLNEQFASNASITITHQLLAISPLSRVLVLEQGRITEAGTCSDLAQSGGWFARQYSAQREYEQMKMSSFGLR